MVNTVEYGKGNMESKDIFNFALRIPVCGEGTLFKLKCALLIPELIIGTFLLH